MKRRILFSLAGLLLAVVVGGTAFGQTTIVSDNYNVTTTTTGFALDNGVNSGINPPTTRLTGTAAANLRYIQTATAPVNERSMASAAADCGSQTGGHYWALHPVGQRRDPLQLCLGSGDGRRDTDQSRHV